MLAGSQFRDGSKRKTSEGKNGSGEIELKIRKIWLSLLNITGKLWGNLESFKTVQKKNLENFEKKF